MEITDYDYRIKSPCYCTFQADNPLIVKGLLPVVPPYLTEKAKHQTPYHVLKDSRRKGSRQVQHYRIPGKRAQ